MKRVDFVFIIPALAIIGLLIAFPTLYVFYLAFTPSDVGGFTFSSFTLTNFSEILTDSVFWLVFKNTIVWTVLSVSFQFILGLLAALTLNLKIRGRTIFRGLLLIPWITPGIAAAITWKWMYDPNFGIIAELVRSLTGKQLSVLAQPNTALLGVAVVNIWKMFPFVMLMTLAGLQAIPEQLYDAAEVDGATAWQRFVHISIPQLRSVMVIVVLLLTIWTFNSFTFIHVMTRGGPALSSEILGLYIYRVGMRHFHFHLAASAATVLFLFMLIFSFLYLTFVKRTD